MVKGIGSTKTKKKPWKNRVERDAYLLRGAALQQDADCDIVRKLDKRNKKKK